MNEVLEWHDKLFTFLLKKRKKNQDLKFWLRQRKSTKNKRWEEGYWFRGGDQYISIGFSNVASGDVSIQSITFQVIFNEKGLPHSKIQILFKDNPDNQIQECYKEIIKRIGDFEQSSKFHFQRFYKTGNILDNLDDFVEKQFSIIREVIIEKGLEEVLLIPDKKFNWTLKNTLKMRETLEKLNILIVSLTWNSKDWKELSEDVSGHKWVQGGNIPHESWNFDLHLNE